MTIDENNKILLKKSIIDSEINSDCFEDIYNYLNFLIKKNNELNLISRKLTINEIIFDHVFDCLAGFKFFKDFKSITDLGSGGGFPGILLGIVFKDKKITLIEKSPKKIGYLNEAVKYLNLKNIIVFEGLVNDKNIDSDVITCRAFKSMLEIIGMTKKYFDNNGNYILYKATMDKINEELSEIKKKFKIKYDIIKIKEFTEKERHLVFLNKINN